MRGWEIDERGGEEVERKPCGFVVDYGLRETLGARIALLAPFGGGGVHGENAFSTRSISQNITMTTSSNRDHFFQTS